MRRFGTQILMYEEYTAIFRAESSITCLTLASFKKSLLFRGYHA
jgi:hypothetical protein